MERIRPGGYSRGTGLDSKSGLFLKSRRRQRFLEYLVNETLNGRGERLKGYNVGPRLRSPRDVDLNIDPIVRLEPRAA